FFGFVLD
ncbi:hypothetical protein AVEN_63346-1, partial [Araneus ventricosus]